MALVKYEISDNKSLFIESSDYVIPQQAQYNRLMEDVNLAGVEDRIISITKNAFDNSLDSLKEFSKAIFSKIEELSPNEIEVEFSIKVSGEGNFVVAKAKTEGNFTLKLTWKK